MVPAIATISLSVGACIDETKASFGIPGGGGIFPCPNHPRRNCPLANFPPPPPCKLRSCVEGERQAKGLNACTMYSSHEFLRSFRAVGKCGVGIAAPLRCHGFGYDGFSVAGNWPRNYANFEVGETLSDKAVLELFKNIADSEVCCTCRALHRSQAFRKRRCVGHVIS